MQAAHSAAQADGVVPSEASSGGLGSQMQQQMMQQQQQQQMMQAKQKQNVAPPNAGGKKKGPPLRRGYVHHVTIEISAPTFTLSLISCPICAESGPQKKKLMRIV